MCWRPSACTATTPPCRCWPRAGRGPAGSGSMCATTAPSAGGGPAGRAVPLLPRSRGEPPQPASRRMARHPAGRRLCRLQRALPARPRSGAGDRGALLGHARRKFFELADIAANARKGRPAHAISPLALEAVRRIDAIFDIEREINGLPADAPPRRPPGAQRAAGRRPASLDARASARRLSRHAAVAKAMDYMLKRWDALHPLPRRRPHLPDQQRRRARAARHRPRPQGLALRRLRSRR